MRQDTSVDISSPDEDESCKEAKQRGVCELEERAGYGDEEWDFGVSYAELVEVVEMCNAKVQRGKEDDLLAGELG